MKSSEDRSNPAFALERRADPRVRVCYRLDVFAGERWIGYLCNLSLSGLRVMCRTQVDLTTLDRLRIALPRWLEMGDELELRCRSAWWRPARDDGIEAGFAVESPTRRVRNRLQMLLARLVEASTEDGWL
jgi:hypothetical protein